MDSTRKRSAPAGQGRGATKTATSNKRATNDDSERSAQVKALSAASLLRWYAEMADDALDDATDCEDPHERIGRSEQSLRGAAKGMRKVADMLAGEVSQ